jgi:hypothetical protein
MVYGSEGELVLLLGGTRVSIGELCGVESCGRAEARREGAPLVSD